MRGMLCWREGSALALILPTTQRRKVISDGGQGFHLLREE